MKRLIFFSCCFLTTVFRSDAQVNYRELTGKWKFVKMESASSIGFDLDHLTESYKDFYDQQKRKVYHDTTTTNDSLYIQVLFEKLVNDANKMFISFSVDKHYETNGYDKSGNMTEKNETGTYFLEKSKNVIYTYPNGNKNRAGRFQITFLDKTKLVIVFNQSSRPAVFTCRRVSE